MSASWGYGVCIAAWRGAGSPKEAPPRHDRPYVLCRRFPMVTPCCAKSAKPYSPVFTTTVGWLCKSVGNAAWAVVGHVIVACTIAHSAWQPRSARVPHAFRTRSARVPLVIATRSALLVIQDLLIASLESQEVRNVWQLPAERVRNACGTRAERERNARSPSALVTTPGHRTNLFMSE